MSEEVNTILSRRYPSYEEPLKRAWSWNREATADSLNKAGQLLKILKDRYPHVLQIRYEFALNLVKRNRREDAHEELQKSAADFKGSLDEDTLCLMGRIYKDWGDQQLTERNFSEAEIDYRRALHEYLQAFT